MWQTTKQILLSQHQWSAIVYLIIGAIVGALISVRYAIRAQRPRLIITGGGSGGNQHHQQWSISVSNRPSFFGQNLDGESARNVHAHIRLKERKSQSYMIYWADPEPEPNVTIEPGQQKSLQLFHWNHDAAGYVIVDHAGEPVARFQARELAFLVRLIDRLGRVTEFPVTVEFDDSHLKNAPRLRIVHPISFRQRMNRAKFAARDFLRAFQAR